MAHRNQVTKLNKLNLNLKKKLACCLKACSNRFPIVYLHQILLYEMCHLLKPQLLSLKIKTKKMKCLHRWMICNLLIYLLRYALQSKLHFGLLQSTTPNRDLAIVIITMYISTDFLKWIENHVTKTALSTLSCVQTDHGLHLPAG